MIAPLLQPDSATLQFLALLDQFGRARLRRCWDQGVLLAHGAERSGLPVDPAFEARRDQLPLLFDRVRAATGVRAETLPWEALGAQLEDRRWQVRVGPDLPPLLREIPDPPLALYGAGELRRLEAPAVSIVGARRATQRSLRWTEQVAGTLAAAGLSVVSGMAFGVDSAAHRGALPATVAVLGSGLARPSPRSQTALFERILEVGGAVVSEYSLNSEATKYRFPERNRLVTGLSAGVLVVEASERSGSLISARLALEQGREVMAVPGPVGFPGSRGCHRLLKAGAALVESAADVLEVLGHSALLPALSAISESPATVADLEAPARQVLEALDGCATSAGELLDATGLSAEALAVALGQLELRALVHREGGGYIRAPLGTAG